MSTVYQSIRKTLVLFNLFSVIFCFCSFQNAVTPYERLKKGEVVDCAFYNADAYAIVKFKSGYVTYSRWSGLPGSADQYKMEEYTEPYTYTKSRMSGQINALPFIIVSRTFLNTQIFYLQYNGLTYVLSESYSD